MRARPKKLGGGLVLIDKVAVPEVPRVHRTYFGFKARMMPHVLRWSTRGVFVEAFCGGASLSWTMHRLGRDTLSGDASYLAYLHAAGSVAAPPLPPGWPDLDADPVEGFACALLDGRGPKQKGALPLTRDAARWLDGLCTAQAGDLSLMLAAAKALDCECRAMRFPSWTNKPVGLTALREYVAKWAALVREAVVPGGRAEARHGLAHETLASRCDFGGGTLYLDPAWPFADGSTAAAFYSHPARVGEIVAQRATPFDFLGTGDHLIYILGLVRTFFERGGQRVLTATQSTNSPSADELEPSLFSVARVLDRTTRRVEGGSHGTGFVEDMFTLEAPR